MAKINFCHSCTFFGSTGLEEWPYFEPLQISDAATTTAQYNTRCDEVNVPVTLDWTEQPSPDNRSFYVRWCSLRPSEISFVLYNHVLNVLFLRRRSCTSSAALYADVRCQV